MSGARLSRAAVAELSDAARRIARDNRRLRAACGLPSGGARSAGAIPRERHGTTGAGRGADQFWFLPRYPYVLVYDGATAARAPRRARGAISALLRDVRVEPGSTLPPPLC